MIDKNIKLTNFNNRVYSKDALDNLIERSKEGRLYGELGYKKDFDVSLSNVSHIINNIQIYDDGIYGDIKILDTESGKLYKSLMDNDIECSLSERSTGTIENGIVTVGKIFSYDLVGIEEMKLKLRRKKLEKIMSRINDKRR